MDESKRDELTWDDVEEMKKQAMMEMSPRARELMQMFFGRNEQQQKTVVEVARWARSVGFSDVDVWDEARLMEFNSSWHSVGWARFDDGFDLAIRTTEKGPDGSEHVADVHRLIDAHDGVCFYALRWLPHLIAKLVARSEEVERE